MSRDYVLHTPPSAHVIKIDYRSALNDEQYEAVTAKPGPLLVIAGAGSGKTRTLTYRVAYLIEHGVEAENILLLTFTNKAAKEMLERVGHLIPHDLSRLWGGTFHSVCNKMLRRHANQLGFSNGFTILDREDSEELARACIRELGWDKKDDRLPKAGVLLEIIGTAVNNGVSLAETIANKFPWFVPLAAQLEDAYVFLKKRKKNDNVMDYDDLLYYAMEMLKLPDIRKYYQEQFQHVLVDEYQDTNKIQSDFIDVLAGGYKQIMVVGDDAQSIYSWRGANFQYVMTFGDRYPGTRRITIETNYRSSPEILALANYTIAANLNQFPKNLRPSRQAEKYPKPALISLKNSNDQAALIAQRIGDLMEEGVELNEIAVLYRAHFHAMELQMELTRRNIPFELLSGLRFFEQAHVKDVAAFLKFALNPQDEVSFLRIAKLIPGVGEKTASRLWPLVKGGTHLAKVKPPEKGAKVWQQFADTYEQISATELKDRPSLQIQIVLDAVYEDYMKKEFANFSSRIEDLSQLRAFAETFSTTEEFLVQLALLSSVDGGPRSERKNDYSGPGVRLSTIHQAKGLEWKAVFVIMLCEGMFPHYKAEEPAAIEEERRLFYVAVTRAQDELYLTHPFIRATPDGNAFQEASRFIKELPRELVNVWRIVKDQAHNPHHSDHDSPF